jgi:hypothetical protein
MIRNDETEQTRSPAPNLHQYVYTCINYRDKKPRNRSRVGPNTERGGTAHQQGENEHGSKMQTDNGSAELATDPVGHKA